MAEADETPEQDTGGEPTASGAEGAATQSEEELRAQYEEQIRQVRVQDLVLQSAVSILQLSARRIAKEDEKDLEQARIGIDAANAMIDHVPEEAQGELRQAVSELKMLWAQHSDGGGGAEPAEGSGDAPAEAPAGAPKPPPEPKGPGLWTPGS